MSATTTAAQRVIRFGSAEITFTLITRSRRDLSITVQPNLDVVVVAPGDRTIQEIEEKVRHRAPWIIRQQLRFRDLHPLPVPKRFVGGETHPYMGRQYRLRVLASNRNHVSLRRPFLVVEVKGTPTPDRVRQLLCAWFRERANVAIRRQMSRFLETHPSLRSPDTTLRVRRMARRWGSCAPSGTITLNPELVTVSPSCIEYVIAHELCHRKVMNHGPRFERLLSRVMPDWRARRERLNRVQ